MKIKYGFLFLFFPENMYILIKLQIEIYFILISSFRFNLFIYYVHHTVHIYTLCLVCGMLLLFCYYHQMEIMVRVIIYIYRDEYKQL